MSRKIIVYDNFYKDPDFIRNNYVFDEAGNLKVEPLECMDYRDLVNSLIGAYFRGVDTPGNGCFSLNLKGDDKLNRVTSDLDNKWTCIVFLTPEEVNSETNGVTLWKDKETGSYSGDTEDAPDELDESSIIGGYLNTKTKSFELNDRWEKDVSVYGKYNRAVFFRSDLYHTIGAGFGENGDNGRVIQTYYFGDNNESN